MSDHNDENLENELRDVLAHQAEAVGKSNGASLNAIELAEPVPMKRGRRSRAVFGGVAGVIATAAAVTVVVMTLGGNPPVSETPGESLAAALAQMSDAGNFDVTYDLSVTERTDGSTTSITPLLAQHITGTAMVHLDPFTIQSDTEGESFSDVTMYADSELVWLSVAGASQPPVPLDAFARTTGQGTLGPRQGPVAMMALASPTGYLTLTQEQTQGATALAESEIEGVPVSEYEVVIPAEQMDDVPGTSDTQAATIRWALDTLGTEGYTGTTMRVAVGDDGYIYWVLSTANFADGATVVIDAQFSNFGCAAPISLPNGQVTGSPCEQTTETSAPETTTPDATTPEAPTPSSTTPDATTPDAPTPSSTTPVTLANPVSFLTEYAVLEAQNFAIEVGGQTFSAQAADVVVDSDPGDEAYTTLEVTWFEHGVEMRLYVYFESDGSDWWANEIRTYDGNAEGEWVTFTGEFFRSPLNTPWTGTFDETAVENGVESRLRLEGARVEAFTAP